MFHSIYEQWAREVPGVARAFVYPNYFGLGTVGITFLTDGIDSRVPDAARVLGYVFRLQNFDRFVWDYAASVNPSLMASGYFVGRSQYKTSPRTMHTSVDC